MARSAQTFKQTDVTRALKAAKAAGIDVTRIKITRDGSIELDVGSVAERLRGDRSSSEQWDEALK